MTAGTVPTPIGARRTALMIWGLSRPARGRSPGRKQVGHLGL